MGTQSLDSAPLPPYLPFKTFLNFIDLLHDTAVPQRIDNSVMSKYPGSIKTQLRTALRFIGAIDDSGIVQPPLRELVKARGTDEWRQTFTDQFFGWYGSVIGSDFDIDSGTLQQLKERFKLAGTDGSVLIKATRFYLAALEETGATYSPHFKTRGALTGGTAGPRTKKPKATRKAVSTGDDTPDELEGVTPVGFNRLSLPLNGDDNAVFILPKEMKEAEWEMLSTYVRLFYRFDKGGKKS